MFYKHVLISFPNKSPKNMSIWVFKIKFLKWDSITQNNGHFADMFIAITQQESKIYIYIDLKFGGHQEWLLLQTLNVRSKL